MIEILVPTSPGELIDKLTILRTKSEKITDFDKAANVQKEFLSLQKIADLSIPDSPKLVQLWSDLQEVNKDLWAIEDDIRDCETRGDFGPAFIALARSVYVMNDQRAALKKRINLFLGSNLVEEKSYQGR